MEEDWKDKLLVASIDFGTTHTGFALSVKDYQKIVTRQWLSSEALITEKTSTVLLLKPNGTFDSFGYDAETKYVDIAESEDAQDWRFFRHFKMELHRDRNRRGISTDSVIKDTQGRNFSALQVFTMSIKFIKDEITTELSKKFDLRAGDMHYVLTVPAIWSDAAKVFMRKAAKMAGIDDDHLRIALEPECAATFIRTVHLPVVSTGSKDQTISMSAGSAHVVVDLGGGTCDIAAHVVNANNKFEEITPPDGGPFGAGNINAKFESFLISVSGAPAFEKFKRKHPGEYLDLQRQFELKKKTFKGDDHVGKHVSITLPCSLRKLHKEKNMEKLSESLKRMDINNDTMFKSDKIFIDIKTFKDFYKETIDNILLAVEGVMSRVPHENVTLLFVGGFSNCALLQKAAQERFRGINVLFPPEAETAVMQGAVIYGRDESIVNARISRFTYGIDWNVDFVEGVHPVSKKEETEDGDVCKDIFKTIIRKGQRIEWDKQIEVVDAYPKSKYQTEMEFPFYRSEELSHPTFVTDVGCKLMKTMKVSLGDIPCLDRCVTLIVYAGKTEIKAEAKDKFGTRYSMKIGYDETDTTRNIESPV